MTVLHLVKTVRGAAWALRQIAVLRALGIEIVVALPSRTAGLARQYAKLGAEVLTADLDFTPHFKEFIRRGVVDVTVTFGTAVPHDRNTDRKSAARSIEAQVRRFTAGALRDRKIEMRMAA